MKKQFSLICTTILILSACTSQIEATSNVTPLFENAISQTPSFTLAPPSSPTNDIKPTFTITGTPEPSPTTPQSTVDAMATLDSLAGTYPELKLNWGGSISPNGNWGAFDTFVESQNVLKLVEINGTKQWEINFFDIYGSQHEYIDRSVGSVSIGHWSKDGAYVYLEPHPEWDGPGLWFGSGATLIRFNLKNGTLVRFEYRKFLDYFFQ